MNTKKVSKQRVLLTILVALPFFVSGYVVPILSRRHPSTTVILIRRHTSRNDNNNEYNLRPDDASVSPDNQQQQPYEGGGNFKPPITTLGGGTALMFEMIRASLSESNSNNSGSQGSNSNQNSDGGSTINSSSNNINVLPRWRPYSGVSNSNNAFRTDAPSMTNEGFARSIWRNLRKRNKPSLWQHALRTYDRMAALEAMEGTTIRRFNIHYEGAMLACAKLGLWSRALEIYHYVYQKEQDIHELRKNRIRSSSMYQKQFAKSQQARTEKLRMRRDIRVSDDMILSLVKACVRASRQRSRFRGQQKLSREQEEQEAALRRIPLDTALEVLSTMEENHNIPITAIYVNPLAKAYQSLGYIPQAHNILQTMLSNRTAGEEPESGGDIVNVYDFSAKDKGSYSLLVEGAVVTGEWGAAVEALGEMIDAGLYPNKRHSNIWSEISERQTRPRAHGSWKKKRDDIWMDSIL